MMKLIQLTDEWQGESAYFLEGAILAANISIKPLSPQHWCTDVGITVDQADSVLVAHINQQHNLLLRSEYRLAHLGQAQLIELASGFFAVWPVVEHQYQDASLGDGSMRMLQALITTFMLLLDEEKTHQQMQAAGVVTLPVLADYLPQLDLMVNEVALAADELMVGGRSQSVNPYKDVGRNEACPCGSGQKFKRCCAN